MYIGFLLLSWIRKKFSLKGSYVSSFDLLSKRFGTLSEKDFFCLMEVLLTGVHCSIIQIGTTNKNSGADLFCHISKFADFNDL